MCIYTKLHTNFLNRRIRQCHRVTKLLINEDHILVWHGSVIYHLMMGIQAWVHMKWICAEERLIYNLPILKILIITIILTNLSPPRKIIIIIIIVNMILFANSSFRSNEDLTRLKDFINFYISQRSEKGISIKYCKY